MEIATAAPIGNMPAKNDPGQWILDQFEAGRAYGYLRIEGHEVQRRRFGTSELLGAYNRDKEIMYVCALKTGSHHGRPVYVQTNVWQTKDCPRGFARMIMRELSSRGAILVSSDRQRRAGSKMWKAFIQKDCTDRNVYLQYHGRLNKLDDSNRGFLLMTAYLGDQASQKVFIVSDEEVDSTVSI